MHGEIRAQSTQQLQYLYLFDHLAIHLHIQPPIYPFVYLMTIMYMLGAFYE